MNRATLIKLVHAGARKLFRDDDLRRDWQRERTGHESCRDMSDADLENLVAELRRKGALDPLGASRRPPRRAGKRPNTPAPRQPLIRKIEALLADKARRQGSTVPWSYADAIASRVCGVERVQWCTPKQLGQIVAALSADQRRMNQREGQQ
jgi:phage gp16-like protein